jgi:HlyD family secretion protein
MANNRDCPAISRKLALSGVVVIADAPNCSSAMGRVPEANTQVSRFPAFSMIYSRPDMAVRVPSLIWTPMDVPRSSIHKRNRLIKRIIIIAVIAAAIPAITLAVLRLQPAAPTVEWGTIWPDTVKRGPMIRQVRGLGTLTPLEVLYIPAQALGRVEKIYVRPGTQVKADTVILTLSNPELDNDMVGAEFNLKAAEAAYTDLRVQLESQGFDKEAAASKVNSDYVQAKLKADRDKKLADAGLIPTVDLQLSTTTAEELQKEDNSEKKRLQIINESVQAQLDAQKVKIEQLKALYELKKKEVDDLKVRAGINGVETALPVEEGQQIAAGTVLAEVSDPTKLKAQLKITETEAKDIVIGQQATIDTHNGIIPGHVMRIDPAAVNGTVTVDVGLDGALPAGGARPDQSVDGTVELEHLADVLQVGRPTIGQPNSTVTLFKISPDQKYAVRATVKLGRASVNTIEVLDGLKVGDQVVLSDMNQWDSHDRIRFNH